MPDFVYQASHCVLGVVMNASKDWSPNILDTDSKRTTPKQCETAFTEGPS